MDKEQRTEGEKTWVNENDDVSQSTGYLLEQTQKEKDSIISVIVPR